MLYSNYIGGFDSSVGQVGSSRNFNGDIAELICYRGYLTEPDRQTVTTYLQQKYFSTNGGGSVTYQWQFDGTNIVGATNSSLILTNFQLTNTGFYLVIVSNSAGVTLSSNALVTVGYPPFLATQPQGGEIAQGTNFVFTVVASAAAPVTYQWLFNGFPISQATNAALVLTNVQLTNAGSYNVIVGDPFGSVLSVAASLTVDSFPLIVGQPQSQTIFTGTNVTFSVNLSSSQSLPSATSGTLALWLKADAGVFTNPAGQVSQWQDQSGNSNTASQTNVNLQPVLINSPDLFNRPVVRFNGIQNNINGSYLNGFGRRSFQCYDSIFSL